MGRHADREQQSDQNNGRNGVKDGKNNRIYRDARLFGQDGRSNVCRRIYRKSHRKRIQDRSEKDTRKHNDRNEVLQRNRLQERGAIE